MIQDCCNTCFFHRSLVVAKQSSSVAVLTHLPNPKYYQVDAEHLACLPSDQYQPQNDLSPAFLFAVFHSKLFYLVKLFLLNA